MLTRYYGHASGTPFRPDDAPYVVFAVDDVLYSYGLDSDKVTELTYIPNERFKLYFRDNWKQFTTNKLNFYFPKRVEGTELIGVKKFLLHFLPYAFILVDKPVVDGLAYTTTQKPMSVIGQTPAAKPAKSVEINPKKGSVYFNVAIRQMQRIVEIQGSLYWASYHKQECKPYPKQSFRLATQDEVNHYFASAKD